MKRRTFLKAVAAAAIAPTVPAAWPMAVGHLRVFTNGCDTVIAPSIDRAKDIVSMIWHGKPLAAVAPDELDEYVEGPDGWSERTDLDYELEIGGEGVDEPTTKTLRQWIADEGECHLCIAGEYC